MVADFWSFSYGRNKRLRSVQEVQPAVIAHPFLCSEVSSAHVCYALAPRRITSWIGFDWRYECVLRHGNKGQNKAKEGLGVTGSWGRSLCVVCVWFELPELQSLLLSTNRHSDTVHRSKQTPFFFFTLKAVEQMVKSWVRFPILESWNRLCFCKKEVFAWAGTRHINNNSWHLVSYIRWKIWTNTQP